MLLLTVSLEIQKMIRAFPAVKTHLNNLKVTGFSRAPTHKRVLNMQFKPLGLNQPCWHILFIQRLSPKEIHWSFDYNEALSLLTSLCHK